MEIREGVVDVLTDPSWRQHLKCIRRVDGTAKGSVWTAWDSQYPLNRLLNLAIRFEDPGKVSDMGFGLTTTTIKSMVFAAQFLPT